MIALRRLLPFEWLRADWLPLEPACTSPLRRVGASLNGATAMAAAAALAAAASVAATAASAPAARTP